MPKKTRKPGQGGWGGPGPEPGSMPRPKVPYRGTGSAVGTAPMGKKSLPTYKRETPTAPGFTTGGKPPGIRPLPRPKPGATLRQPTPAELKQKRPLPRAKKR